MSANVYYVGFLVWYEVPPTLLTLEFQTSQTSCCHGDYLCQEDLGVLDLYDRMLHVLQKFNNRLDIGVGQFEPPIWA